jgi:hypothetical protein
MKVQAKEFHKLCSSLDGDTEIAAGDGPTQGANLSTNNVLIGTPRGQIPFGKSRSDWESYRLLR